MVNESRGRWGWFILRVTLAGLIAAHGWYRLLTGGSTGFGGWLDSQGIPFGLYVAWSITLIEVAGSALLALGFLVLPVTLVLIPIYLAGIVMVHAPAGWFVVGGGRNGAEYSVLLIVCLVCVALQHLPGRGESRP